MRRLLLISAVLAATLAVPATTLAAGPVRETAVFDFTEPEVFGSCDGFDMIATSAHIERTLLTWLDADGNPVYENRHVFFDFTLVNSVSGTEARYVGRFKRTFDFVTEADALIGAYRQLFIDHRNVWSASGVDAIDDEGQLVTHGHSSLLGWEEGLCAAMA